MNLLIGFYAVFSFQMLRSGAKRFQMHTNYQISVCKLKHYMQHIEEHG